MIPRKKYSKILEILPILCVDIIIKNSDDQYLLIKRSNEPLKDEWWVIGGRVIKGETLEEAAQRKVKEEVGLVTSEYTLAGYYEDPNEKNPFGLLLPQHSVSIVFITTIDHKFSIKLDDQSSAWKLSKELPKFFLKNLIPNVLLSFDNKLNKIKGLNK